MTKMTMADYLNQYPPKKGQTKNEDTHLLHHNRKINGIPIDAYLDLHGSNTTEALNELKFFIKQSINRHYDKVLIIHGKGKHSLNGKAVLKEAVIAYLIQSKDVRKIGRADFKDGGDGATWAILKLTIS